MNRMELRVFKPGPLYAIRQLKGLQIDAIRVYYEYFNMAECRTNCRII